MPVVYGTRRVENVDVFYREAGPPDAPVVLLLHGFPTSGHMFRDLIPELADHYRVIAPDLPGFGNTVSPPRTAFTYSFDRLAEIIDCFTEAIGLTRPVRGRLDPTRRDLIPSWPERAGGRHGTSADRAGTAFGKRG